ncbi:GNAT family N-acetyltransferase [Cellulomonas alba]|uniref:GNAT family protein n=1 Tax=Cellulomonas alba TaxID=3053467 RepID=A0ABT7SFS9_9CELL|nr:GNAT family protein [Cellulomonas alba]MDM7855055.1 GNAT family protein [Cellulomonas alba]
MDPLDVWPFPALRVTSGDLELRYLDDDLLLQAALLAADGVHAADAMPFTVPWTRGTPAEVATSVLRYQWSRRAELSPERWVLELAVLRGGELVGLQGAQATEFRVTRQAETGSWLGLRFQGQGIGTRMRRLILHLLFEGLGAERATTTAFADNARSNGVTRRVGYRENGRDVLPREGAAAESIRYVLTRDAWAADPDRPEVALDGVAAVRRHLGVPD